MIAGQCRRIVGTVIRNHKCDKFGNVRTRQSHFLCCVKYHDKEGMFGRCRRRIGTSTNRTWNEFANVLARQSSFLRVQDHGKEGRGVFATHEIERSTKIFTCKPLTSFVTSYGTKKGMKDFCRGCLKCLGDNEFITIDANIRYCSETCRDESMRNHDELLLRLNTLKLKDVYEKEDRKFPMMVTQLLCSVLQEVRLGEPLNRTYGYVAENLGHLCNMKMHRDVIRDLQEEYDMILDIFAESSIVKRDDMAAFFPLSEYARLLGTLHLNVFEITNENNVVSVSLLPGIASFFNHSCTPNVEVVWNSESQLIEFITVQDVKQFSQLRFGYLDIADNTTEACQSRSKVLHEKYGFKCRCVLENEVHIDEPILDKPRRRIYSGNTTTATRKRRRSKKKKKIKK